jgi:cytochrome c oxidase subunit II
MAFLAGSAALAEGVERVGVPQPGGMGLQPNGSNLAVTAHWLDSTILWIIAIIVAFVTLLMLVVMVRFNRRANPTPARFSHNTPLEVAWTLIPIAVLVFIGSFSLPALFEQLEIPEAEVNVKITGNQWYWSYEYSDAENPENPIAFDSIRLEKDQLEAAGYQPSDYLLAVDNPLVVPVGKNVVITITASDVAHAWYVPALAVQHTAVPGRLGQMWFKAEMEGLYFGQCTTLCGKDHAYMPIAVRVVSQEAYEAWLVQAKAGNVTLALK